MIDKLGGRKFIFAMFAIALTFVLVLAGKIESDFFLKFVSLTGTTYIIGNVAESIGTKEK